jgi:hypothetical protein
LGDNMLKFEPTDPYIFIEIAAQNDCGGADPRTIVEGVDYRHKLQLTDSDLILGLYRLKRANYVRLRKGKFFIKNELVNLLPVTKSRQLSFRQMAWSRLSTELFGV